MNSFWMQFRLSKVTNSGFIEKKNYICLTRDIHEKLRDKKVKEAEYRMSDWAFNEHLKNLLFSCQRREANLA